MPGPYMFAAVAPEGASTTVKAACFSNKELVVGELVTDAAAELKLVGPGGQRLTQSELALYSIPGVADPTCPSVNECRGALIAADGSAAVPVFKGKPLSGPDALPAGWYYLLPTAAVPQTTPTGGAAAVAAAAGGAGSGIAAAPEPTSPLALVEAFARQARALDLDSLKPSSDSSDGLPRTRYIDIELPGLGKRRIYIRHFFHGLLCEVLGLTQTAESGRNTILGGTPCTGKTLLGLLMLMVAIRSGKTVAYWNGTMRDGGPWGYIIAPDRPAAVFTQHVRMVEAMDQMGAFWVPGALYVTDAERPWIFADVQTVVITSPCHEAWEQFAKCDKDWVYPMTVTYPTWSLEELRDMVAQGCQTSPHPQWEALFELYGGVPGNIFSGRRSEEKWKADFQRAARAPRWTFVALTSGPLAEVQDRPGNDQLFACVHFRTRGQRAEEARAAAAADKGRGGAGAPATHTAAASSSAASVENEEDEVLLSLHPGQDGYYAFDGLIYASRRAHIELRNALITNRREDVLDLGIYRSDRRRSVPLLEELIDLPPAPPPPSKRARKDASGDDDHDHETAAAAIAAVADTSEGVSASSSSSAAPSLAGAELASE